LQAYHKTAQFVPLFCCIYSSKFNTSESNQIEKKIPNLLVLAQKRGEKPQKAMLFACKMMQFTALNPTNNHAKCLK